MSTEILSIDNGKDIGGFVYKKVLSFESYVGAGDGHNAELIKSSFAANTSTDMEEAANFQDESIATELFANALGSVKRKLEEDGYEWKPSPKPDVETAASKIDCLIGKLKRRFNDEKQVRANTIKPSYSQYVFSNSVDAFLRYHEKPKVEIQYSEVDGDIKGEGLYSFAVRPSRIKKRRKYTFGAPKASTNPCIASQSAVMVTGLDNSGEDGSATSAKFSNTVSTTQTTDEAGDVFDHNNSVICNTPSVNKASEFTAPQISKCTSSENINGRVISPNNHIQKSEKVDGCVIPPASKTMVTADVLPNVVAIASPPDPYFRAIAPICKGQSYTKSYGHAIHSMPEYHSPYKDNNFDMLPFKNVDCSMLASPLHKVTLRAEINDLVYKADVLVNILHLKRRICDCAKYSLYKKLTSIEIAGHNNCLIHKVLPDEEFCGDCVPPIFRLIKAWELCVNTIHLFDAFQKIGEAGTKIHVCKMPVPKQIRMSGIKEINGHSVPQIGYTLTYEDSESCAATPILTMTLTEEVNGDMVPEIYKVGTHPYKDWYDNTVSPIIKRVTMQEITGKAVTQIFKTQLLKEVYVDDPQTYKSTPEEVHDHKNVPINDVSTTSNSSDSTVPADNKGHTVDKVKTIYDTIIDEFDDDSTFGIMSIYCNSKMHSRCGGMLEAERSFTDETKRINTALNMYNYNWLIR